MAILHLLLLKAISYRFVGLLSETKLRNFNIFILFYTSVALTSPPFSFIVGIHTINLHVFRIKRGVPLLVNRKRLSKIKYETNELYYRILQEDTVTIVDN